MQPSQFYISCKANAACDSFPNLSVVRIPFARITSSKIPDRSARITITPTTLIDASTVHKMAEPKPSRSLIHATNTEGEENKQENDEEEKCDSDLEWGDEVVARGYYRNAANLEEYGFRPVWWEGEYPYDEIPDDIREYLNEDGRADNLTLIGPLRSIAWLAGIDELVEAIDSPAYTIEDSIEVIPFGCTLRWPLRQLDEEGLISARILEQAYADTCHFDSWRYGRWRPCRSRGVKDECPAGVGDSPVLLPLKEITRQNRVEGVSGSIMCMKVKNNHKGPEYLEKLIRRQAEGLLGSGRLWFRGLSMKALRSTLAFFIPQVSSNRFDNEFGPGFYTSDGLEAALNYIQKGSGAVMVFKNPDLLDATVWHLETGKLEAWVARWTSPTVDEVNEDAPPEYRSADFIKGPLSKRNDNQRGKREQWKSYAQLVAVSYKGCQILANALFMIIFVEPK
ncbi:hypothetical protein N8T08_005004 [Aspergillus melleus]|uniref:Uncharacterized protein n=1 Tax=Aspergillus melleus TaxID=138277 RepID=A0ACC3B346_9EURO|nr:hypothetical protein N8T08_005004 [Aspergillus melleus]